MNKKSGHKIIKYLNRGYYTFLICIFVLVFYFYSAEHSIVLVFLVLGVSLISLLYLQVVKHYVQKEMKKLSGIIDKAIDGKKIEVNYDETELSLLTSKISRFVKIRNKEIDDSRGQRERFESLVADISHQTKTPISNIVLYSNLILEHIEDGTRLQLYTDNLNKQSKKLKWLIEKLIHMSRLENDIIQCEIKQYKIDELIIQSVNQIYSKAVSKNIEVKYTPSMAKAYLDIKWTSEAVANIIDNAIKYSSEKSTIGIDVVEYEQFLCVRIKDYGIGISEEELPYIFQRFYRSKRVSNQEGLGIGLYLARKIIAVQKGYIKVISKQDEGAIFQIYLPLNKVH